MIKKCQNILTKSIYIEPHLIVVGITKKIHFCKES